MSRILPAASRGLAGAILLSCLAVSAAPPARAVPSFAAQTGQPCVACHIGAFGPQLTPFGRAFKIGGYTQDGGDGPLAHVPLAAMAVVGFTHTQRAQPEPPAAHFARNDNAALNEISLFLAGRLNDHVGGFAQGTYSGIDRSVALDNTDLRLTTTLSVASAPVRLGLSVNNNPTVQDPWNSTPAWSYPFTGSDLSPTPAAAPLLADGLAAGSVGVTAYAWYDDSLYLEAGLYNTLGRRALQATGGVLGPGATAAPAPYVRLAYEWNWAGQSAHVGALFLHASLAPATGPRTADASQGRDGYSDFALDTGYQFLGERTHVATLDALVVHEEQDLRGSTAAGASSRARNRLDQISLSLSYWWRDTIGVSVNWRNLWGSANPARYAPDPIDGSASGRPDSTAFTLEADWAPFGKDGSWGAPLANLKLGAQYTLYTRFNGGGRNYDGFGHDAGDNNTLFLFGWLAF